MTERTERECTPPKVMKSNFVKPNTQLRKTQPTRSKSKGNFRVIKFY